VEHEPELLRFTISSIKELGLTIDDSHAEQFMHYLTHLTEWNKRMNLTAITDPREIIIKHFVDSLAALAAIGFSQNSVLLDAGSGAGFPGIPLKILRSDLEVVLVEPIQKKCSFLNSVIGLLKLRKITTFDGTIEQYAKQSFQQGIDAIVLRALKFEEIKMHISALLTSRGKVVLYRAEPLKAEEIWRDFQLVSETNLILPQGFGKRVISVIEKVA
jgi:16S rRNA (guanine527-N7)-methyltransferase